MKKGQNRAGFANSKLRRPRQFEILEQQEGYRSGGFVVFKRSPNNDLESLFSVLEAKSICLAGAHHQRALLNAVVTSAPLSVQPAKWLAAVVTKALRAFGLAGKGRGSGRSSGKTVSMRLNRPGKSYRSPTRQIALQAVRPQISATTPRSESPRRRHRRRDQNKPSSDLCNHVGTTEGGF